MNLKDLLLKKEELPILYENCFQIPIHPMLINPTIKIERSLAKKVFLKATEEWYSDLQGYVQTVEDVQMKKWILDVFLKEKPKIKEEYGDYFLNGFWRSDVSFSENGFARALSINRNNGGTLYYREGDFSCKQFIPFEGEGRYIQFSEEKVRAFSTEIHEPMPGRFGGVIHTYASHNIDFYPGALFLRNWAVLYINSALEQIFR